MSAPPVLPAVAVLPPTLAQASAAAGNAAAEVSFESVLEAQLGIQDLQNAQTLLSGLPAAQDAGEDPQPAPMVKDTKTKEAPAVDDAAAAGQLFIPVTAPVLPPVLPTTPTHGPAPDRGVATSNTEVATAPPALPSSLESRPAQGQPMREPATDADPSASPPAAASVADALQTLPVASATDAKPPLASRPIHDSVASPDAPPVTPAQAAHLPETTSPVARADLSIAESMSDARWGDAFSQRVVWMVGQKLQSAEFRVEPPQLGPIEVRLSITNDQANLLFNAPHAVAREAIQTSLPRLQEMLLESGVALGNVSVGTGRRQDQPDPAFGRSSPQSDAGGAAASGMAAPLAAIRRGVGLVDLFA